jgi:transposase
VYQVHDWAKVRELVREGVPKQRIAEQLGCSRTTVYRLAGLAEPPGYERRPAGSQLEPFKDAIAAMLLKDDAAPATVIRERLQRRGYSGGVSILKDYLRELRPLYRGRDYQRTVYAPGEILQADWWDTGLAVPVGKGQARRAYGFVTTLPFSAAHSVVFTHSQTTADVLPALLGCLARLGGVPAKLVMGRDSSLVARAPGRRARPVDELVALLGALSMGHVVLPAYSPQSKGSVERTNGYLETSFLPLRRFEDLADLQHQHDVWAEEVAWQRHLRRLGGRVSEALAVERAELGRPARSAARDRPPARGAGLQGRLRPRGRRRLLAAARLRLAAPAVRLAPTDLVIFCEGRMVAQQARSYVPCDMVRDGEHMAALAAAQEARRRLRGGEPTLEPVDLGRYDALVGAPL